jgi:hypothetical protein
MAAKLTGWGLWAIPAAGVLTLLPWVAFFFVPEPNANADPGVFARTVTDALHTTVGYLYLTGLFCLLFGVLAISAWLQDTQVPRGASPRAREAGIVRRAWNAPGSSYAAVGMVFGIIATVVVIGTWTILVIATPTVADVYLSGHPGASEVFKFLSGGHWGSRVLPLFIVAGVSALVAAYTLGDAIRRSGRVPKWVGPVFGIGLVLTIISAPLVSLVGSVLVILSGVVIARGSAQPATRVAV